MKRGEGGRRPMSQPGSMSIDQLICCMAASVDCFVDELFDFEDEKGGMRQVLRLQKVITVRYML